MQCRCDLALLSPGVQKTFSFGNHCRLQLHEELPSVHKCSLCTSPSDQAG